MQRIPCDERSDWQQKAEAVGFQFHTIDGERYWDERAYYAFTLEEIDPSSPAVTAAFQSFSGAASPDHMPPVSDS